jgi:maleylpyruvate isomerase
MQRLVAWAITGVPSPMYASVEDRAAGIDSAADLPGDALGRLVAASASALAEALARLAAAGPEALGRLVYFGAQQPVGGPDTPASALAWARLREVEIHHVDLGLGYRPADWPEPFVQRTLAWIEARTGPAGVVGDPAEVLAWRLGRGTGPTVRTADGGDPPEPPPW